MYTYDEVIASGYLVFGSELSSLIIQDFYRVLHALGRNFDRTTMKMDKLHDIIDFKNLKYVLKENKSEEELYPYMNPEVIMIFKMVQQAKEEFQEQTASKQYIKK
ncbi:MAG: hypothetical protein IJ501_01985 [Bacilli bacterium]|nr:hypothetical protein [Bacilli bacterium]